MDELLELDRQKKELSDSQTQIKQELVGMGYTKEAISIVKKLMEMEGALRNEVDNDTENLRVKCGVPKQHSLGLV